MFCLNVISGCPQTTYKHNSYPQLLLLVQQIVVLVALIQSHQNVLQPVPHTHGELLQLIVHAGLDVCKDRQPTSINHFIQTHSHPG